MANNPTMTEPMTDDKKQTATASPKSSFLNALTGLGNYEGYSPKDIEANVNEVLSSKDDKRVGKFVGALKGLKEFKGWNDDDIKNELKSIWVTDNAASVDSFDVPEQYIPTIKAAAKKYNIPESTFAELLRQESDHFSEDVITGKRKSKAGALGIAQFMPATAEDEGIDPLKPEEAIEGSAKYLRKLIDQFGGDTSLGLAAYNAGPGNVEKAGNKIPDFPETQQYVDIITKKAQGWNGAVLPDSSDGYVTAAKRELMERQSGAADSTLANIVQQEIVQPMVEQQAAAIQQQQGEEQEISKRKQFLADAMATIEGIEAVKERKDFKTNKEAQAFVFDEEERLRTLPEAIVTEAEVSLRKNRAEAFRKANYATMAEQTNNKTGEKKLYVEKGGTPRITLDEVIVKGDLLPENPALDNVEKRISDFEKKNGKYFDDLASRIQKAADDRDDEQAIALLEQYNADAAKFDEEVNRFNKEIKTQQETVPKGIAAQIKKLRTDAKQRSAWQIIDSQAQSTQYADGKKIIPVDFAEARKIREAEEKANQLSPKELATESMKAIPAGAAEMSSSALKGIDNVVQAAKDFIDEDGNLNAEKGTLSKWAQSIDDFNQMNFPTDRRAQEKFVIEAFRGVGSSLPFMGAGLVTGLVRAGVRGVTGRVAANVVGKIGTATQFALGMGAGGSQAYDEAIAAGLDKDKALALSIPSYVLGALDPITEMQMTERLMKGIVRGAIAKEMITEGGTEMIQTAGQEGTGKIAGYNEKELWEIANDVFYSGVLGATSGGMMSGGVSGLIYGKNALAEKEAKTKMRERIAERMPELPEEKVNAIADEVVNRWKDIRDLRADGVEDVAAVPKEPAVGMKKVSSTQVNLPEADAAPFKEYAASIPEEDIYDDESKDYGREKEPHVTALFGLKDKDSKNVAEVVKEFGDVKLEFGKTSLFTNDKFDVLKVDVKSDDMRRLNALLQKNVEFESDFPDYTPHVTIAYLKPGEGKKYADDARFEGITTTVSEMLFSDPDYKKTPIDLNAKKDDVQIRKPIIADEATNANKDQAAIDKMKGIVEGDTGMDVVNIQSIITALPELRGESRKETLARAGEVLKGLKSSGVVDADGKVIRTKKDAVPAVEPAKSEEEAIELPERFIYPTVANFLDKPFKDYIEGIEDVGSNADVERFALMEKHDALKSQLKGKKGEERKALQAQIKKIEDDVDLVDAGINEGLERAYNTEIAFIAEYADKKGMTFADEKERGDFAQLAFEHITNERHNRESYWDDKISDVLDGVIDRYLAEKEPIADQEPVADQEQEGENDDKSLPTPNVFDSADEQNSDRVKEYRRIASLTEAAFLAERRKIYEDAGEAKTHIKFLLEKQDKHNYFVAVDYVMANATNISEVGNGTIERAGEKTEEEIESIESNVTAAENAAEAAIRSGKEEEITAALEEVNTVLGEFADGSVVREGNIKNVKRGDKVRFTLDGKTIEGKILHMGQRGMVVPGVKTTPNLTMMIDSGGDDVSSYTLPDGTVVEKVKKPTKKDFPVAINPEGQEYTIRAWAHGLPKLNWEWYGFQRYPDGVWSGFVHGFEDEYGTFSEDELRENGIKLVTNPNELKNIAPPVGWKWKEGTIEDNDVSTFAKPVENQKPEVKPSKQITPAAYKKGDTVEIITGVDKGVIATVQNVIEVGGVQKSVSLANPNVGGAAMMYDVKEVKPSTAVKKKIQQIEDKELDDLWGEFYKPGDSLKMAIVPVDPEKLAIGVKLIAKYTELGALKFADIVNDAYARYGDKVKEILPSLKQAYMSFVATAPEDIVDELSSVKEVRGFEFDAKNVDIEETGEVNNETDSATGSGRNSNKPSGENVVADPGVAENEPGAVSSDDVSGGSAVGDVRQVVFEDLPDGGSSGENDDTRGSDGAGSVAGTAIGGTGTTGENVNDGGDGRDNGVDRGSGGQESNLPEEARNHRIEETDVIGKPKVADNVTAIELLLDLEAEDRLPTIAEKKILARYAGWGGLAPVFDDYKGEDYLEYLKDKNTYVDQSVLNWGKQYGKAYKLLKELLSPQEWDMAKDSTLNAHYTSRSIVTSMWNMVRWLGFKGGNVLEPAAGIGNFFGLMPEEFYETTKLLGVELDSLTGRMLKKLYPQADIQVVGLEGADFGKYTTGGNPFVGFADLIITNNPFAATGAYFPTNDKKSYGSFNADINNHNLHNQFLIRELDALKPGGLLLAITTTFTMDSATKNAREEMAKRGDLIGAIRLPWNAFKENAKTEVTTDILIFRKKSGGAFPLAKPFISTAMLKTAMTKEGEPKEIWVNEYFVQHPEMMLGEMGLAKETLESGEVTDEGGLYNPNQQVLRPRKDEELTQSMLKALMSLPARVTGADGNITVRNVIEADKSAKDESYQLHEGQLLQVHNGKLETPDFAYATNTAGEYIDEKKNPVKDKVMAAKHKNYQLRMDRAKGFIAVRDAGKALIELELSTETTDDQLKIARAALNKVYDAHVKKHGYFGNNRTHGFLDDDPEFAVAMALENEKSVRNMIKGKMKETTTYEKADIFNRRVVFPFSTPSKADSVQDAVMLSLQFKNFLDTKYVASLLSKDVPAMEKQLLDEGFAFRDPETTMLVTKQEYLSGLVRNKLRIAEQAIDNDPSFQKNVDELKKVIPIDILPEDINFTIGASWVPADVYSEFVEDLLGVKAKFELVKQTNTFVLQPGTTGLYDAKNVNTHSVKNEKTGATKSGLEIFLDSLNSRATQVRYIVIDPETNDKKSVVDAEATEMAVAKQREFQESFKAFIKGNEQRKIKLAEIYNDIFNGIALKEHFIPTWDRYPNATIDPTKRLRDYQRRGVARCLIEPTLLAHFAGAGKTFQAATITMEARRLGIARKPMIVVQNTTLKQFAAQYKQLYPGARLLVPSDKQRQAKHRKKTAMKIATNDWDAVIIPKSYFELMEDDPDRVREEINSQINELMDIIFNMAMQAGMSMEEIDKMLKGKGSRKAPPAVKEVVRKKKSLERRLKEQADRKVDKTTTFEKLGVDYLIVDESHDYKKLGFTTRRTGIKGIDPTGNQLSFSLWMKLKHIFQKTGNKNVVFMTGTPITNTMAEAWTQIRYLRPDILKVLGITDFDQFMNNFGNDSVESEYSMVGEWELKTRFRGLENAPEFIKAFRTVADVVLEEDANIPDMPKMKDGRPTQVVLKQTPPLKRLIRHLKQELRTFKNLSPKERFLKSHIPITVFTEAKKGAIDIRLVNPLARDYSASKTNVVVNNVFDIWKNERAKFYPKGMNAAQLIFCDLRFSKEPFTVDQRVMWKVEPPAEVDELGEPIVSKKKAVKVTGVVKDIGRIEYRTETGKTIEKDAVLVLPDGDSEERWIAVNGPENIRVENPEDSRIFDLYKDLRDKLIAKGIPEDEVVILDKQKDKEKEELFEKANNGEVRIIIGHTEKLGIGVNVQRRLIAEHHLDAPSMPYLLEQRSKRMVRFGNLFGTKEYMRDVLNFMYGVEKSLDATAFQMLMTKQKLTDQTLKGNILDRSTDDSAGELQMSVQDMQASLTGDPRVLVRVALERKIKDLEIERESAEQKAKQSRSAIQNLTTVEIPQFKQRIADYKAFSDAILKAFPDKSITSVKIDGALHDGTLTAEELATVTKDGKVDEKKREKLVAEKEKNVRGMLDKYFKDGIMRGMDQLKQTFNLEDVKSNNDWLHTAIFALPEIEVNGVPTRLSSQIEYRIGMGKVRVILPEGFASTTTNVRGTEFAATPELSSGTKINWELMNGEKIIGHGKTFSATGFAAQLRYVVDDVESGGKRYENMLLNAEKQLRQYQEDSSKKFTKDDILEDARRQFEKISYELETSKADQPVWMETWEQYKSSMTELTEEEDKVEHDLWREYIREAIDNNSYAEELTNGNSTIEEVKTVLKSAGYESEFDVVKSRAEAYATEAREREYAVYKEAITGVLEPLATTVRLNPNATDAELTERLEAKMLETPGMTEKKLLNVLSEQGFARNGREKAVQNFREKVAMFDRGDLNNYGVRFSKRAVDKLREIADIVPKSKYDTQRNKKSDAGATKRNEPGRDSRPYPVVGEYPSVFLSPTADTTSSGIRDILERQLFERKRSIVAGVIEKLPEGQRDIRIVTGTPRNDVEFTLTDRLAKLFTGNDLTIVDGDMYFNGFYSQKHIFLHNRTQSPALYITVHEAMHNIHDVRPELYGQLMDVFKEEVPSLQTLRSYYDSIGKQSVADDELYVEALNDYVAREAMNEGFWDRLASKAPDIAVTLFKAIRNVVKTIQDKLGRTLNIKQFVRNADRLNEMVEEVLSEYLRGKGRSSFGENVKFDTQRLDLTQSEAFKKWFGKSKVVDEAGKPLRVYHGTDKSFDSFDTKASNQLGAHFTPNPEMASEFAETIGGVVYPVYLSLKNPLDLVSDLGDWTDLDMLREYLGPDNGEVFSDKEMSHWKIVDDVKKSLVDKGYDGIKYQNSFEGDTFSGMGDVSQDVYIAFFPTQIKSATGNNGNFNGQNADIRYSVAPIDDVGPRFSLASQIEAEDAGKRINAILITEDVGTKEGAEDFKEPNALTRPSVIMQRWSNFLKYSYDKVVAQEAFMHEGVFIESRKMIDQIKDVIRGNVPEKEKRSGWEKLDLVWKHNQYKSLDEFLQLSVPLAAHLNATAGDAGQWEFTEFEMRAGFLRIKDFQEMQKTYAFLKVGDEIEVVNPLLTRAKAIAAADAQKLKGPERKAFIVEYEENNPVTDLRKIGEEIKDGKGNPGYQLLRKVTAETQHLIYDRYSEQYPLFIHLIDQFIDPRMSSARKIVNGVSVPVFNRYSLAEFMKAADPEFEAMAGYTPDVFVNRSIIGVMKMLAKRIMGGSTSPGRRYKSGQARETGNVMDIVRGFNTRAFQVLREQARQEFVRAVIATARQMKPNQEIPDGWVELDRGIGQIYDAIKAVRRINFEPFTRTMTEKEIEKYTDPDAKIPNNVISFNPEEKTITIQPFYETKKRLMIDDQNDELNFFNFINESKWLKGERYMLPKSVVAVAVNYYATEKMQEGLLGKLNRIVKEATLSLLVHPGTFVINYNTNKLFTMEAIGRKALAGIIKLPLHVLNSNVKEKNVDAVSDFAMVKNVAAMAAKGAFLGTQQKIGTPLAKRVEAIIPGLMFKDSTVYADVSMNANESARIKLMRGEISGALLTLFGYGNIDIKSKQRYAVSYLTTKVNRKAAEQGLSGPQKKEFIKEYFNTIKIEDRIEAVKAAEFEYLNYRDIPSSLQSFQHKGWSRLFIPFLRFGYSYMLKQKDKIWDNGLKAMMDTKKTRNERVDGFANALWASMIDLGVAGLVYGMLGFDDDDEPREIIGSSQKIVTADDGTLKKKTLDRELNTANRVNISRIAPAWFKGWMEQSGIVDADEDAWMRLRNYPMLYVPMLGVLAGNDLKRFGAAEGVRSYLNGMVDLTTDFFNFGVGINVPSKVMQEIIGLDTNPFDKYGSNVPLITYTTENVLQAIVPFGRQADEVVMWIDPVHRRITESKKLDYNTEPFEQLKNGFIIGHFPGVVHRALGYGDDLPSIGKIEEVSFVQRDGESFDQFMKRMEAYNLLGTAQAGEFTDYSKKKDGTVSEIEKIGYVKPEKREYNYGQNLVRLLGGANIKGVNRDEYEEAIREE